MSNTDQKLPIQFGSFYLYDKIGIGGMAEIFLAKTFTGLGIERHSAIKCILPLFVRDESFGDMLILEAKLCARLSHGNIVQTYDLGKSDGRYYISMEYVEGFDLNRLLGLLSRAEIKLPLQFALYIIIETLRGLDYAHRLTDEEGNFLGIVHRDVSPTNVLISTEGEIKLCDFGIAKVTLSNIDTEYVDDYHLKGKIAYMSPEYLSGREIDCRADLYAAGILLWELLSGRRLFKSKDEEETLRRAKNSEVPPLTDSDFPEYELINAIVKRALSKDTDKRFQTGQQFIRAIEDYMHLAGLIISQLKFSDFLMEHFGESLLEQRRERERSLAELEEYQKEQEAEEQSESLRSLASDERTDAILASFTDPADLDDDNLFESDEETDQKIENRAIDHAIMDSPAENPNNDNAAVNLEKQRVSLAAWIVCVVVAVSAAVFVYYYFFGTF
ncbi:MAG: serine/threonine protein kinase [Proteobacteria bacterium]|nr:serine/threonine protein kinase [Pseudomonadota bacterium]